MYLYVRLHDLMSLPANLAGWMVASTAATRTRMNLCASTPDWAFCWQTMLIAACKIAKMHKCKASALLMSDNAHVKLFCRDPHGSRHSSSCTATQNAAGIMNRRQAQPLIGGLVGPFVRLLAHNSPSMCSRVCLQHLHTAPQLRSRRPAADSLLLQMLRRMCITWT
jgi:hypothetical protein